MRARVGFISRFLVAAAVLFAMWSPGGIGDAYSRVVVRVAAPVMRVITGFAVRSVREQVGGIGVWIGRGKDEAPIPLQPREAFSGIIPFLALVVASAGLSVRRRLRALAYGVGILFAFHVGLMVLGVYFTGGPQAEWPHAWVRPLNTVIDVVYGFYGLVGYAALPFVLWLSLLYRPAPDASG